MTAALRTWSDRDAGVIGETINNYRVTELIGEGGMGAVYLAEHPFMGRKAAIKVLRDAGLLGILADVNAHPKEGVFVPLFGVPACTSAGPATLAIRTNSVILPLAGVWDEKLGKYIAVNGELIEPTRTGDRQKDIVETTARFTAEVEKLIRAYPDQWLWIHKRWKSRPPGEPELY